MIEPVQTSAWVGELMDASIDALPPYAVAYSYDNDKRQWGVQPWTIPGEQPVLQGYNGGPLVIQSSHDPRPTGLPIAGIEMKETPEPVFVRDCQITVKETAAEDLNTKRIPPLSVPADPVPATSSRGSVSNVIAGLYVEGGR